MKKFSNRVDNYYIILSFLRKKLSIKQTNSDLVRIIPTVKNSKIENFHEKVSKNVLNNLISFYLNEDLKFVENDKSTIIKMELCFKHFSHLEIEKAKEIISSIDYNYVVCQPIFVDYVLLNIILFRENFDEMKKTMYFFGHYIEKLEPSARYLLSYLNITCSYMDKSIIFNKDLYTSSIGYDKSGVLRNQMYTYYLNLNDYTNSKEILFYLQTLFSKTNNISRLISVNTMSYVIFLTENLSDDFVNDYESLIFYFKNNKSPLIKNMYIINFLDLIIVKRYYEKVYLIIDLFTGTEDDYYNIWFNFNIFFIKVMLNEHKIAYTYLNKIKVSDYEYYHVYLELAKCIYEGKSATMRFKRLRNHYKKRGKPHQIKSIDIFEQIYNEEYLPSIKYKRKNRK